LIQESRCPRRDVRRNRLHKWHEPMYLRLRGRSALMNGSHNRTGNQPCTGFTSVNVPLQPVAPDLTQKMLLTRLGNNRGFSRQGRVRCTAVRASLQREMVG